MTTSRVRVRWKESDHLRKPKGIPQGGQFATKGNQPRIVIRFKGGQGSGNFGHAGRPGEVGGSAAGNSWSTSWGQSYTADQLMGMDKGDFISTISSLSGMDNNTFGALTQEYFRLHPPSAKPQGKPKVKPEWKPKNALPLSGAEDVLKNLPEATGNERWAVRYTNDWPADKQRGYSYADWGIEAYSSRADAESVWPKTKIVYDKGLGGYMPVLSGLSSYTDNYATDAFGKASDWARGKDWANVNDVYRHMVVYRARHVGFGSDGEDLTVPTGKEEYIFDTGK